MHFTHYQKAGDKVFAVNPSFEKIGKYPPLDSDNENWKAFETWLSTQPPIYADPSIKDGVYAKELFEEPVWQYKETPSWGGGWTNCSDNNPEGATERGWPIRLYIRLKQPVKQEEKEVYVKFSDIERIVFENMFNHNIHSLLEKIKLCVVSK